MSPCQMSVPLTVNWGFDILSTIQGVNMIKERWLEFCNRVGISSSDEYGNVIYASYGAPDRHYHVLEHIDSMLQAFDSCRHRFVHPDEVEYAIFMHDIIYDMRANDNERRSAELAADWIVRSTARLDTSVVQELVMATVHKDQPTNEDARLLVDIDTMVFAGEWSAYLRYASAIRLEYAWVPEAVYRSERARILKRFLGKERVFLTDLFDDAAEERARENILHEILILEGHESDAAIFTNC